MYCNRVDVERTIRTQRICFNESKWNKINNDIIQIMGCLFAMGLLIYAISFEIGHRNDLHRDALGSFFSIFLPLCLLMFMVFHYSNNRKLTKVSPLIKMDIVKAINELNWIIDFNDANCMVILPDNWKQITIVFDGRDAYIHSLREGRFGYSRSLFMQEELLNKIDDIKKTPYNTA
jgi:hypothetical protein